MSIRFLAALVFGECSPQDYKHYHFTKNTPAENKKSCPCTKDSSYIGINAYPAFLMSVWKEILRLTKKDESIVNPEEKANQLFDDYIKRSIVFYDVLHYTKGNWSVIMDGLATCNLIDIKEFKLKSGGKKEKSPNQMSGSKARNTLAGYPRTILPHLKGSEEEKRDVESLLECATVLQFLSYAPISILKDPLWRPQSWIYAFIERIFLKKVFKDKVNDYITLHTHGTTHHLPSFTDFVVCTLEKAPVECSTEKFESKFAKINKINSNKHEENVAVRHIEQSRSDSLLNHEVARKRNSKKHDNIEKWTDTYVWKKIVLPLDLESRALISILTSQGYKEQLHWNIDLLSETLTFCLPPARNTSEEGKNFSLF